jgi:dihydrolipoamide dehydrogenase
MDRIIPGMDASLSKELTKKKTRNEILIKCSLKEKRDCSKKNAKGETITLEGDYALVGSSSLYDWCRESRSEIIR